MTHPHSEQADYLRRRAKTCAALAKCATSHGDQARLMWMHDVSLARAAKQDWLKGLPPLPPSAARALAVPL